MTKARRGIYAAAITPFDGAGRVAVPRMIAYCLHLLSDAGGCDGVAPTGTTGEGTSVAQEDRLALPAAFAAAGIAPDRVIFGTGAAALPDCVALTRAACAAGFRNVLVLPPFYYKDPSEEALYTYYARLIEQVADPELRVYLYHFPKMAQVPIPVALIQRLRASFGSVIAGLKDSSGDFAQSRAFIEATGGVDGDFDVYPSSEAFLWDGLSIGAAGIISGSTNVTAPLVQAAREAQEGPARDGAMARVRDARAAAERYPLMAAMKTIESWRSGEDAWLAMQPPLLPLSDAQCQALAGDLATMMGRETAG